MSVGDGHGPTCGCAFCGTPHCTVPTPMFRCECGEMLYLGETCLSCFGQVKVQEERARIEAIILRRAEHAFVNTSAELLDLLKEIKTCSQLGMKCTRSAASPSES
jgi:hypothetical protein